VNGEEVGKRKVGWCRVMLKVVATAFSGYRFSVNFLKKNYRRGSVEKSFIGILLVVPI
jgi:hypothetical protein